MPENFKVAEFKEVKLKVAIDSMGKAKVYVLKRMGLLTDEKFSYTVEIGVGIGSSSVLEYKQA